MDTMENKTYKTLKNIVIVNLNEKDEEEETAFYNRSWGFSSCL